MVGTTESHIVTYLFSLIVILVNDPIHRVDKSLYNMNIKVQIAFTKC